MSNRCHSPCLAGPFRLIHADLDPQNLLFIGGGDMRPPHISGVLDWEYAYTGPLYFLYDYPIFIQDSDNNKAAHAENAVLRQHFMRVLSQCFPPGCADQTDIKVIAKNEYTLNWFHHVFIRMAGRPGLENLKKLAEEYGSGQDRSREV